MARGVIILWLSALSVGASAQSVTLDSIQRLAQRLKGTDSIAARHTLSLAYAAHYTETADYKQAFSYLQRAQDALGADTVDNVRIISIKRQRGIAYTHQGNFARAIELFAQCKKYYSRNALLLDLTTLQSDIGYVFADLGNYEFSLMNYFEALTLAEANNYEYERTQLLFRIAWVYYLLGQNEQSYKFALRAKLDAVKYHHPFEESSALNLMGMLADRENRNEAALDYFNKSLAIRQRQDYKAGIASTLLNIGILLEKQQRLREALDYDLQSLTLEESTQHGVGMAYSYQSLGQLYTKLHNYDKANQFLVKAEKLSRSINAKNILRDVFENKRDLLDLQGKHAEAVRYSRAYETLKDSLFHENLLNRIGALQNGFELDQKDKEIKILSQQKEIQDEKLEVQNSRIQQQWIIISVVVIGFIVLCVIAFMVYGYNKKLRQLNFEITHQNEEIQTQSEELTEANDILSKLNHEIVEQKEEIQAQSEELAESYQTISQVNEGLEDRILKRTAELQQAYRELDTFFYRSSHDFRRPLTTFMGLAEVAKITIKDESALELFRKVDETARNLDKMLVKLQSISDVGSQELIFKEVLVREIFELVLNHVAKELEDKSIQVSMDIALKRPFISYPALVRIVVENLVENAIAFCGAIDPFIRLRASDNDDDEVIIEVQDNGQGIKDEYKDRIFEMYFRASANSKGNGLGLYIVKKTALKLDGRVEIESAHNLGTNVKVYLPNHKM